MRVLVLGPSCPELEQAAAFAGERGARLQVVDGIEAVLARVRDGRGADVLLIDVREDVATVVARLLRERIHLPVIAFGIAAEPREAVAAIRAGAREFLPLPPEPELIAALLAAVVDDGRELVSEDPAMGAVLDLARRYAPADACVLITGESGTGKEVIARFVHAHSRRAERPLIAVNCAAIPDNLLESELFGHEKGSFTGAVARRIGKFEEAHGGTMLLDEISEMEPRLQAKLLRAIQEREIDRVGGTRPVKVDIRLIATSNRDLARAVDQGAFREDLLFRISVLTLELPPLRRRPRDVLALASHFARKLALTNGVPVRPLSPTACDAMVRHPWRGNVRELENCIHRAVILARGPAIEADDLRLVGQVAPDRPADAAAALMVGRSMADVERSLIIDTVRHTGGNRTHAAGVLGISIRTLRNKLKQYTEEGMAVPAAAGEMAA